MDMRVNSNKKITRYIITGILSVMAVVSILWYGRQYYVQRQLAEKVLRFHVLANSDSSVDQNLKLLVRDEIGNYLQEEMKQMTEKKDCENYINNLLPRIKELAEELVKENGFAYPVQAELTTCHFPMKTYGVYTFPEGNYDALKITIGEGEGQNWWCVLYPNMCFENSMYEVVGENAEKELRKVLDEEEYQAVLSSGDYEVRFWFLELFNF